MEDRGRELARYVGRKERDYGRIKLASSVLAWDDLQLCDMQDLPEEWSNRPLLPTPSVVFRLVKKPVPKFRRVGCLLAASSTLERG